MGAIINSISHPYELFPNTLHLTVVISKHMQTSNSSILQEKPTKPTQEQIAFDTERILDENPALRTLKQAHSRILVHNLRLNPSLGIKLMRAYGACGNPAHARKVFDEIPHRNVVFFNVLIRGYVNNQLYRDALLIYGSMTSFGTEPDKYTFPCVLKACSGLENLHLGSQIHGVAIRIGYESDLFVGNALIAMYAKCKSMCESCRVFTKMANKDIVSWNAMVAGHAQNGRFEEALELCKEMELQKLEADAGTMASLLPALIHTDSGNVAFIRHMFEKMPQRVLVSWNAMIAVYVNNAMAAEAMELFSRMETEGIEPDQVTLASILPACGDLSALEKGKDIHEYIIRKKLGPNLFLDNALIDMYSKCGSLQKAREVFDGMVCRDVVSWTSLISAYGMHGQGKNAVSFFSEMRESGLKPDHIAFVSVLSACSHAGLLNEGRHYFDCMIHDYRMVPRIEHYACMVDLLGRAGQLEEAYDLIKQMPVEPNEKVWGALLSACRIHSNISLGVITADHLFKLVPDQAGYYVLLSNIYAAVGRWNDVSLVRSTMKGRGVKKLPAYSNVELDKKVHSFLVGDRSHPQSKEIYEYLEVLVGKMKEAGYVAETDLALHDVEEEDKEIHLAVHSEKLAIVFALLNTRPGMAIRITKNLRVCGDCHCAAKFISKITGREIILRDTNRFHHFQNGVCSCSDYW